MQNILCSMFSYCVLDIPVGINICMPWKTLDAELALAQRDISKKPSQFNKFKAKPKRYNVLFLFAKQPARYQHSAVRCHPFLVFLDLAKHQKGYDNNNSQRSVVPTD